MEPMLLEKNQGLAYAGTMHRRLATILCLLVLGLAVGGCSKCGPLWDQSGHACHAETPR
jgi:hypothetical protein